MSRYKRYIQYLNNKHSIKKAEQYNSSAFFVITYLTKLA
ncbi:hypothetical protein PLEI_3627 [Photobacterium leiognathi lrivu.4.1]|uniref:Uncharacterized protein n=1 Tax=Photobacterium leiognathi lrivu.4.1 TaxID=1248232 RepID=V5EQ81_PHOLE|nr:hypothetical protein PLEI_3627 [Photobacterium leiognathi lrivu.4.1]